MTLFKIRQDASSVIEHFFLVAVLAFVSGLFVHNDVLWRWDNLLYDAQLTFWERPVSKDIIIIAIDDESLNDLGRWPWPRSVHAQLINQLELESPQVIGLDIIFSETDLNNPLADVLLARAMRSSGNVVLPVFMAQISSQSYPMEALPLPEFTANAAALGHVHIDISDDGIARRVFLKEGIGEPHWLHYSLAVLSKTDKAIDVTQRFSNAAQAHSYSPLKWSRELPYLIPYAGPPGHVQHIGYSQVLSGHYQKGLFKDKIVLIGTTAEGLGDALPTPLSGNSGPMPGIEIVANIIDALSNDIYLSELDTPWLIAVTVLLVALPVLIYRYLNPVMTLLVLSGFVLLTISIAALLLWLAGIWMPVSTILLFQLVSYPLWSWRRLVLAMRHINAELNRLSLRQNDLSIRRNRNLDDEIRFISRFVPINGWLLLDENGNTIKVDGDASSGRPRQLKEKGWTIDGYRYWHRTRYQQQACVLGLSIAVDTIISDEETVLLNFLIDTSTDMDNGVSTYASDVLQEKINQVQNAGREYESLRHIIDDSLSGMADGVLICSMRGQVMLSNHRAGWYLFGDDHADINGKSLYDLLAPLQLQDGGNWKLLLRRIMLKQKRMLAHTRHESGRDLMVEISPLRNLQGGFDGFVVNFSDISLLKASEHKRNELLNFLSHDLRSPLSSMIAMIELARSKNSIDEMHSMMDNMESNTYKTLHLAEQFLQLSRANTNEKIQFYELDFNSVVLNAIDQIWALSNKLNVSIKHAFDNDEIWTYGEPDLLERAVVNLLSNAIKHSERGSTVEVNVKLENEEIHCCVIDYGNGISFDDLPHLFEMFRRTRNANVERKHGSGLGLAFVDAVARRHSGQVDVESKLDEGSSFCLRIPRTDITSSEKP